MRIVVSACALAIVLSSVNAASADLSLTVVKQSDPAPGLECFWISVHGGQQYEKFSGFSLTGVHQANYKAGFTQYQPTIFLDHIGNDPLVLPYDTHYLFNGYDENGKPIIAALNVSDTNSKTGSPLNAVSGLYYGLGDFDGGVVGLYEPLVDDGYGVPFLQLVVRTGVYPSFSGQIVADGKLSEKLYVYGPEPGTIALALTGGVCMLVVGLRRRR